MKKRLLILLAFMLLTFLVAWMALSWGAVYLSPGQVGQILGRVLTGPRAADNTLATILLDLRLPRVLLALLVGASLSVAGVAFQALLRNPLADPYILGVSGGAALGVVAATLLGIKALAFASLATPFCSFLGAALTVLMVFFLARTEGRLSVPTLLLAGVIANLFFSASIMFLATILSLGPLQGVMYWFLGNLSSLEYGPLLTLALYCLLGMGGLFLLARPLNLLTLGEESASALGVEVEKVKIAVYLLASFITGAVVSASGIIGFVGLIIPHGARMLVGSDHRWLLPLSALLGASFLMLTDTLARTVIAPSEVPVGIITALIGAPCFLYLLRRRPKGTYFGEN